MGEDKLVEEIEPDKEGKFPESVSWEQYVRAKETIGNKLEKATQKVAGLEEQLKKAANPEELTNVKGELEKTKAEHQKTLDELKSIRESTASEKRASLVKRGVPEDKVKGLSEKELDTVANILGDVKPKADMSGGGGGSGGATTPREKIRSGFDSLHPKG